MIRFELEESATVTLRVYDLSGRLVRVLLEETQHPRGQYEVTWNGRNGTGRDVAAGVYFYRLDTGEYSETRRMTLVK